MAAARSTTQCISPSVLKKMFIAGKQMLQANKDYVDSLNVFPVPDGDTGTNMYLTMLSSVKEIETITGNDMNDLAEKMSYGALRGARGNSGVILSQIIKGMANSIASLEVIDTKHFAKALKGASEMAYSAVSRPQEGTILTVIREMAQFALDFSKHENDIETFLNKVIEQGETSLANTPNLLPVLKKAGVIDSGGCGLIYIFKGFLAGYLGQEIGEAEEINQVQQAVDSPFPDDHNPALLDYEALGDLDYGYCTEFFITNLNKKTTVTDVDILRDYLNGIGNSVICIGDLNLVKVHVHTNVPGKALTKALSLGELDKVKIDNMMEQNRQLRAKYEAEKKPIGILSVCSGEGFAALFKDLLVDQVIEGGQTMNPSSEDIASAVAKINAENIIILPNNKNIIMAAEQCRGLVPTRTIYVVPTRNVPQGLNAVLNYNPEADVSENLEAMMTSLSAVTSGEVTFAVRDSEVNNIKVQKGDIIGLDSKKIITKGTNVEGVTTDLISKIKKSNHEVITLFYGKDVKAEDAEKLSAKIQESNPECEIMLHYGGQPLYYYILSLE